MWKIPNSNIINNPRTLESIHEICSFSNTHINHICYWVLSLRIILLPPLWWPHHLHYFKWEFVYNCVKMWLFKSGDQGTALEKVIFFPLKNVCSFLHCFFLSGILCLEHEAASIHNLTQSDCLSCQRAKVINVAVCSVSCLHSSLLDFSNTQESMDMPGFYLIKRKNTFWSCFHKNI